MLDTTLVKYTIQDGVYLIELNNGKANVINEVMIDQLTDLLNKARLDDSLGIVITSKGRFFSAGADIKEILDLSIADGVARFFRKLDELLLTLFAFPKPCITAINGHSIGGGLLIQMCSDYTIAQDEVKIKYGFPEIKIGLAIDSMMAEIISFSFKSRRQISNILYNGELFTKEVALDCNIIDEIVSESDLQIVAKKKILDLSGINPEAFSTIKQVIRGDAINRMKDLLLVESYDGIASLLNNSETREILNKL